MGVANCFAAILAGNHEFCDNVQKRLIEKSAVVLKDRERGYLPHQLSLIESIVAEGSRLT